MRLPAILGRAPTSSAAASAAPEEMPTGMPSCAAAAAGGGEGGLVADRDDLVDHGRVSRTAGTKPAPMP